jgi:hypothetical protein
MKKEIKDEYRRVQCNWCNSVFYEDYIVEEDEDACPVCGEKGYLMDIQPEEEKPSFETPDQWEKRTGVKWPDGWAVYIQIIRNDNGYIYKWKPCTFREALINKSSPIWENHQIEIVCATEAGPPPLGWEPEETE